MCIKTLKYIYIYIYLWNLKKNKLHPLEKLGTEPIVSNVHPMAIRCGLV